MQTSSPSVTALIACAAFTLAALAIAEDVLAEPDTEAVPEISAEEAVDLFLKQAEKQDADGKTTEANETVKEMVEFVDWAYGHESETAALAYLRLASRLEKQSLFQEAIDAWTEHLEIVTSLYGPGEWRTTDARLAMQGATQKAGLGEGQLRGLVRADAAAAEADSLLQQGKAAEAISPAEETLALRRKILGEADRATAMAANNLGCLHQMKGDAAAARPYTELALKIDREVLGEMHPTTALAYCNLGYLLKLLGDYQAAVTHYERSVAIGRNISPFDPATAATLLNYGSLVADLGDVGKAKLLFEEALSIQLKSLGNEDVQTAKSMAILGAILAHLGDFGGARTHYARSLAIRQKALTADHPDVAESLEGLGNALSNLEDNGAAKPFLEQALAIHRKSKPSASLANCLNSLGVLRGKMRDFAAAEALLEEAVEVNVQLGPDRLATVTAMTNLATLLHTKGDYASSRARFEEALALNRRSSGGDKNEPAILNNLGCLLKDMGQRELAEDYLDQSVLASTKFFSDIHPNTAECLLNKSLHLAGWGNWSEALTGLLEVNRIEQLLLERAFSTITGDRIQTYTGSHRVVAPFCALLSLPLSELNAVDDGFTWVLRRKAVSFEALCRFRTAEWLALADSDFAAASKTLTAARRQLDELTLRPSAVVTEEELTRQRASLLTQIAELSASQHLALSAHVRSSWSLNPTIEKVRAQLPDNGALIEFLAFTPVAFDTAGFTAKPLRYKAFVLFADQKRGVEMIDLGDAKAINELILELGRHIQGLNDPLIDWAVAEAEYKSLAHRLHIRVLAPILEKLGGTKRLLVAPDSLLHSLAFESLVDEEGAYLIENGYTFCYLTSGRDLLR